MTDKTEVDSHIARAIFHLYLWRKDPTSTNFTSLLYDLFMKSDIQNRGRLALGFPSEAEAFSLWREAENEVEFFEKFGHKPRL